MRNLGAAEEQGKEVTGTVRCAFWDKTGEEVGGGAHEHQDKLLVQQELQGQGGSHGLSRGPAAGVLHRRAMTITDFFLRRTYWGRTS